MKNHVAVTIAGQGYTLVASEDEAYVNKVAAYVDGKIKTITADARISLLNAAILSAANIADEYFKALEAADNMRAQLKGYLEENARMKNEASELKRELAKAKKGG